MDYNNILDKTLEFLLNKKEMFGTLEDLQNDEILSDKTHVESLREYLLKEHVEYWIIDQLLNQLQNDGFVVNEYNSEKVIIKSKLTFKGLIFINNGGYTKDFEYKNTKHLLDAKLARQTQIISWALAFGTVAYLLWDMYKYSRDHYPKVQSFFDGIF